MPLSRARRRSTICLLLSIVMAPLAGAEETAPPAPAMNLADAMRYALDHQPQIRSALAELAARKSEARIPRAGWYPQVGATAQIFAGTTNNSTGLFLNVPEVDLPRIGGTRSAGTSWSPTPSTLAGVSVDQEIYDFGRIAAQAAVADALSEVARVGVEASRLDIELNVEESYHGVLASHDVVTATEEAYRRAVTHRDYAQAGTTSGMRPPIDLTRAQAEVALLEVQRIRAQSGVREARSALAAAIGSDAVEVDAVPLTEGQQPTPAFDEAMRKAARQNPMILAALARIDAQRETTRAISRELLPNLFASAGLSGRAGGATSSSGIPGDVPVGDGWLPDVFNWHIAAVLQWNLFDATVLARRDAAHSREAVSRADLAVARNVLGLAVERAYLDLVAALNVLPGLVQSVDAAVANQNQADARFKAGLGTIIELADADTLLTHAQLEMAIGKFTIARTRASLARVVAEPYDAHLPNGRNP